MAMDFFSANPCSFKMDKNSTFVSKLKASITEKLNQFLADYTDDVLAEYIVVLVCNGKDQNQAREDLEAFLGERSGEFVSWLWDLLLKSTDHSHLPKCSSNQGDVYRNGYDGVVKNKHTLGRLKGLHCNANGFNDEKEYCPTTCAPQTVYSNDNEVYTGSQPCSQGSDSSLNELNDMEGQTNSFKNVIAPQVGLPEDNCSEVLKDGPSRVKVSSGSTQYVVDNKIVSKYRDGLPHQHLPLPKDGLPSSELKSITREYPKYGPSSVNGAPEKRLSSRPVDFVSHENARSRRSVWDRLGRSRDVNRITRDKETDSHGVDVVKRRIAEDHSKEHDQNRLFVPGGRFKGRLTGESTAPDISGPIISNTSTADVGQRSEHDFSRICFPRHADKFNNKRQFSEIGSLEESKYRQRQQTEPFQQYKRSSSAKCTSSESLNTISSGSRPTELPHASQELGTPDSAFNPGANNVSQKKLNGEASNGLKTNPKPVQSQLLDVKLRLHQIEEEMSKLRAKQPERNEGKPDFLSNSGPLNQSDEDVESRTVFVTNVHFAATKEALLLHFAPCGVVVRVVILTDAITAQPKGAAYIIFAHKESADKAVALSGTSFWSRTLKIVRKTEMPVATQPPPLPVEKPSWSQLQQPNRKVVLSRPYGSSLQWRRDQPVSTAHSNSNSNPGYGLDASGAVEQNGDNAKGKKEYKETQEEEGIQPDK